MFGCGGDRDRGKRPLMARVAEAGADRVWVTSDNPRSEDPAAIAEFVRRELPFGRFGTPEEVGDVVAFLASPRASWISGTSVVVDGCQSRAF